jgi:hypothetical protein
VLTCSSKHAANFPTCNPSIPIPNDSIQPARRNPTRFLLMPRYADNCAITLSPDLDFVPHLVGLPVPKTYESCTVTTCNQATVWTDRQINRISTRVVPSESFLRFCPNLFPAAYTMIWLSAAWNATYFPLGCADERVSAYMLGVHNEFDQTGMLCSQAPKLLWSDVEIVRSAHLII